MLNRSAGVISMQSQVAMQSDSEDNYESGTAFIIGVLTGLTITLLIAATHNLL